MSDINLRSGIQPAVREELAQRDKALSGDIVINVITADTTPEPTAESWDQVILFEIVDSSGARHTWFSGDITAAASNTSTAGTASVSDGTPAVVNGLGSVTLSGDEAAWLATETALCTFGGAIAGKTLANVVFTITFTAV